jgi:hypothetical protein
MAGVVVVQTSYRVRVTADINVSNHALLRFRQRYLTRVERDDLDDEVVAHWLNALLRNGVAARLFEDIIDEDRPARIVEIAGRRQGSQPIYAVVREYGTASATIVTLLSAWMRDQNRRQRWISQAGEKLHETSTGRTEALRASFAALAKFR